MDLQVLVSTMHQQDYSIIEKMNIQSDAIIVNQCDRNEIEEFTYKGNKIKFISLNERGVGLSRNTALMRATAEICLFADDDMFYVDGYKEIVLEEFRKNPNADLIFFNVPSTNINRPTYIITKNKRVRWYNSMRFGAVNIAIRTDRVREENIYFSLLFGGGAKYSSGEDSLFIADCIRKGLRAYSNTKIIGYVNQEVSSWFKGYTDKFFIDKGVFYAHLSKKWAKFFCLRYVLKHKDKFLSEKSWKEALDLMLKGVEEHNRRK